MGEIKLDIEIDDGNGEEEEGIEIVHQEDRTQTGLKPPPSPKGDGQNLKRFGDYLLLDHLIDGGMASICRARYLGREAEKVVAIKMVKPQFSNDKEFKQMFIGEIKVSFGLIHPNIAQTYDYGMIEKQLFVAMEYIDGKNLKQYLDRIAETKKPFEVAASAFIASKICEGLHYAHNFEDKLSGKKTEIVHRDISPHNIMLTYDGAVKVIDFGIAQTEQEENDGKVKGKISYFAPEYLEGKEINHTYDQFAVGLTLWELLVGRKLFDAGNEIATLKSILECVVPPPSKFNKEVPKELDEIVLKSLSRDPKSRYESMDAFNRGLVKFLFKEYPDFNPSDLATFAQEAFAEDIATDRKKLIEFGKIDVSYYIEEAEKEKEGGGDDEEIGETTSLTRTEFDFGFQNVTYKNSDNLTQELELDFGDKKKSGGNKNNKMQAELLKTLRSSGINPESFAERANVTYVENSTSEGKGPKKSFFSTRFFVFVFLVLGGFFVYTSFDILSLVIDFPLVEDLVKTYESVVPKSIQDKIGSLRDGPSNEERMNSELLKQENEDLEAKRRLLKSLRNNENLTPDQETPEAVPEQKVAPKETVPVPEKVVEKTRPVETRPAQVELAPTEKVEVLDGKEESDGVDGAMALGELVLGQIVEKDTLEKVMPEKETIKNLTDKQKYIGYFNRAKNNFQKAISLIEKLIGEGNTESDDLPENNEIKQQEKKK